MANLSEFGSSLETTRLWIDELMATLGTDEPKACRVFRVVIRELRDCLSPHEVADLASQMPLLLQSLLYEGWRPNKKIEKTRSREQFLLRVAESLQDEDLEHVEKYVRYVFMFLDRRISPGETKDILRSLHEELRALWPCYQNETYTM